MHPQKSPRIVALSWGRMEVDGNAAGKDFKLWRGGGREWDWQATNTHHVPGIQRADVEELLEHGSRTIILSRGMLRMLHTCRETVVMLQRQHIDVRVEETAAAAETYNTLAARGEPVGGLFHSTC